MLPRCHRTLVWLLKEILDMGFYSVVTPLLHPLSFFSSFRIKKQTEMRSLLLHLHLGCRLVLCPASVPWFSVESLVLASVVLVVCVLVLQNIYSRKRWKSSETGLPWAAGWSTSILPEKVWHVFWSYVENAENEVFNEHYASLLSALLSGEEALSLG